MRRTLLICIMLFSYASASFAVDNSESSFDAGTKAFKQKQYKQALYFFNTARKQGMRKSALIFNIAATYYKLGDYRKSESNFKILLKDNHFRQIASYNLGLIAEKRQNKRLAIYWYKKAENETTNTKVTRLSSIKLDTLLNRKKPRKSSSQSGIRIAFGNDSNITGAAATSPSNKHDNYTELFAYLKLPVSQKLHFNANVYSINYLKYSANNFLLYTAGMDYSTRVNNWKIIPEISLSQSSYGNSSYQSIFNLALGGEHHLDKKSRVLVHYRYSDIKSQNKLYDYLQGTRHQIRADYINKTALGQLRLRYQFESNNRKNNSTSYSPQQRNEFKVRLIHPLENKWNLSTEIGLRNSKYKSSGKTRNDTRSQLLLGASKKIRKNMYAGIRYIHTDNKSNITNETYNKNDFQLFASWIF